MTRSIALKELKVLWASPLPYALGAVFHVTFGVLAWSQIAGRGQAVFQPLVPIAGFLLVLVAPIVASRSFAEEIRTGTLELLLSIPVRTGALVAGKFLAVSATLLAMLLPVTLLAVVLSMWGDPDPGPIATGVLGLALAALALGAIGCLTSALTASQPVAALGGLFAVLVLWFAHVGSDALAAGGVLATLSVSERLRSFAGGVIDVSDGVFFVSLVIVALAGAAIAAESRRWR